eukprot:TRINITY_DN53597_c0_g1_i1.p1 TRINITY_DN53597_c0_g1~~TRINITY_DN53597_c0_g1_i1.p1  ORF type:complete len:344 (+),score=62.20 TRINITY_DN53597_c0_g1_i1:29-1033(+)
MNDPTEENIFKQRFPEEEEDEDEEEDQEKTKKMAKAEAQGMVVFNNWENKIRSLLTGVIDETLIPSAFEQIKKSAKATCLVERVKSSETRKEYYEKEVPLCTAGSEKKKTMENKLKNWENGGRGTGLLLHPSYGENGWLVITNNHVIMDNYEAMNARVSFEYNQDRQKEGVLFFTVQKLVCYDLRTSNAYDTDRLDFSLLLLSTPEQEDHKRFLKDHGVRFEENASVQATFNENIRGMCNVPIKPIIMFSHPLGLAKRLSSGTLPEDIDEYPVKHITHTLGSLGGSSGGNLLFSPIDDPSLTSWSSAFLHYRHGRAVGWQAIGDSIRASLNKCD